jgi:AcrR family transcriptional regulator
MANNDTHSKREGQMKEQLLKAALKLFTQKGYAGTSVREIVATAGVSKPMLYYYFENKEGIYRALMQRLFGQLELLFQDYHAKTSSIKEQLLSLFDRGFSLVSDNRDLIRLMHAIYYGPPQGAPFFDFDAYHTKFQGFIRQIVEKGVKTGEFRSGKASDMAWALMGAAQIATEEQILNREPQIDRKKLQRILSVIFQGVEAESRKEGKR